eukprot:scaffold48536_cov65-Phaeocystis_antarctica.AAC.3
MENSPSTGAGGSRRRNGGGAGHACSAPADMVAGSLASSLGSSRSRGDNARRTRPVVPPRVSER